MDDDQELIAEYLEFLRSSRGRTPDQPLNEEDFERWSWMNDVVHEEPDRALAIALALLERCGPEDLETIGINILEDLIAHDPVRFANDFEAQLRQNERFFEAFRSVYMGGVPLHIQRQLNNVLIERGVPEDDIFWFDPEPADPDAQLIAPAAFENAGRW